MNIHYLFDVDGTLTPSRQAIDSSFSLFFKDFCTNNSVSLVTGSDFHKTESQLGSTLCSLVSYIFCCSGNSLIDNVHKSIFNREFIAPDSLISRLQAILEASKFTLRTGNHIEYRPGGLNFSIVGRNASLEERLSYVQWDKQSKEREVLAEALTKEFPLLDISIGGETGLDIVEAGCNKAQVLNYFDNTTKLVFFGDAIFPGGNDYPLAKAIEDTSRGTYYTVRSWQETYSILCNL